MVRGKPAKAWLGSTADDPPSFLEADMIDWQTPIFINGEFWRSLTTAEAEYVRKYGHMALGFETRMPVVRDWKVLSESDLLKEVARMKRVVFELIDDPIDYLYADDEDLYRDETGRVWLR